MLRDPQDRLRKLRGRHARAIVGYLAFHAGQHVTRDRLIELVWSDRSNVHARGSLRQCLLEIRRSIPGLISTDDGHAWIESNSIAMDGPQNASWAFELFEDLDDISPQFDQWLRYQRAEEARREWADLEHNVEKILSGANCGNALPLIERMHRIDPYSEDWVRLAMRAQCQLGHPAGIVRCFTEFAECLKRDLGVLPASKTRALYDRLLNEVTVDSWQMDLADPHLLPRLYGMG